jgi:pimeloyl-ACP methyl ester carboxylesterase
VARLIEALGHARVDLLGYSFGGVVAQEVARRSPSCVDRLVLCATTPGLGGVPPNPLPSLLLLTPIRYQNRSVAERIVPVIAGGRTRREPATLQAHLLDRLRNPPSTLGYLSQLYAITGWSSLPWLRTVGHATLILHGDDDPVAPVANARTMAGLMPAADLRVLRGAGHLFLLDDPAPAATALVEWLS